MERAIGSTTVENPPQRQSTCANNTPTIIVCVRVWRKNMCHSQLHGYRSISWYAVEKACRPNEDEIWFEIVLPGAEMHRALWMCWISSSRCLAYAAVCRWQCTKSVGQHIVWPLSLSCRRARAPLWICCVNGRLHYRFVPLVPWNSPSVHPVAYTCLPLMNECLSFREYR